MSQTSGLVLGGRTSIRYLGYDAIRDVHLQVLMHVHPAPRQTHPPREHHGRVRHAG